jgi:hypothetical protein
MTAAIVGLFFAVFVVGLLAGWSLYKVTHGK